MTGGTDAQGRLDIAVARVRAARHDRTIVVEAPAGHGRSELLRRIVDPTTDVVVPAPIRPRTRTELAADVLQVLGDDREPRDPLGALHGALRDRRARGRFALVVDDLHRAGAGATGLLGALARTRPDGVGIVIGTADGTDLGLAELMLDGAALHVTVDDLPDFDVTDPALERRLLTDALQHDLDAPERHLLSLLVGLRIDRRSVAEAIANRSDRAPVVARLTRVPLVDVRDERIDIDPRWDFVADLGLADERRRAAEIAIDLHLDADETDEAGRLALSSRATESLRRVVRHALNTQPPRVGVHALRAWRESRLLPADDPHASWLDAAYRWSTGAPLPDVLRALTAIHATFASLGDIEAEISVGMGVAIIARRLDDFATLAQFVTRATEADAGGQRAARGPAQLGAALVRQMSGDPLGALEVLDGIAPDAFDGDWAAQVQMMRGTNLALAGRTDDAIAALRLATGTGGSWSQAVALDLLANVRWTADDRRQAIVDLEHAEHAAGRAAAQASMAQLRAVRLAMRAAIGEEIAPDELGVDVADDGRDTRALLAIAAVHAAANRDDIDTARRIAVTLPRPPRATRAAFWTASLQVALDPTADAHWAEVAERHPALQPALRAGRAGAVHVAGGPLAATRDRAFLPARWCEPGPPRLELDLLGATVIRRDHRAVTHRYWERARVRELCVHLALVDGGSRELAAEHLWPELPADAAMRNLRVTLTYLLDVIDPDRQKGSGSTFIDERDGQFRFARDPTVRIDLRRRNTIAAAIVHAGEVGAEREVVATARELTREPAGPLVGGTPLGDWVEPHRQRASELLLRAISVAGPLALRIGDHDLAEQLGEIGIRDDPWGERLHVLVVRARFARDDLDGARRALRRAFEALHDLGVRPERATINLARELGVTTTS